MGSMSWVLLLLVACASLVVALPHHHAFSEDLEVLEKGLDEVQEAEEEEEDEEDDEQPDSVDSQVGNVVMNVVVVTPPRLFLALDCGSSGTKFMFFAEKLADCPAGLPPNPSGRTVQTCDEGVKFEPTMRVPSLDEWTAYWSEESSGTTRLERAGLKRFLDRTGTVVAYATAGNRIIPTGTNQTAWNNFRAGIASRYNGLDLSATGTIPGTQEAWFEFMASGGDFVSMGGSSAQFGVKLTTVGKITKWSRVIKRATGDLKWSACNNQDKVQHFFLTLSNGRDYSSEVVRTEFASKCNMQNCVGLASWLSFRDLTGQSTCVSGYSNDASSPGYVNHWAGGVDESIIAVETWLTAINKKGDCFGTSSDAKKCAEHMVRFSRFDKTTLNLKRFLEGVHAIGESFAPKILAALAGAVSIYKGYTNEPTLNAALKSANGKTSGTARFAMWGVSGILVASWSLTTDSGTFLAFGSIGSVTPDPANWAQQVANDNHYPVMCEIAFLQESNANDDKALKKCTVDLERTE